MDKKTLTQLCSKLAKMEGSKHQCSIGDVRELMRCFADLIAAEDKGWLEVLYDYSCRRAKRAKRFK